jgi:hypothetical protein
MGLFLERQGVVEDWLQENLSFRVAEGNFFGVGRNMPFGWEGKTVLVENEWFPVTVN